MGGGDLNLKKSWHPSTLKNQERVWKAEQQKEQEEKKIAELQRELKEERLREELEHAAVQSGKIKKNENKLNWMYKGPGSHVSREEYLLGRKIDKAFEMLEKEEIEESKSPEQSNKSSYTVEHEINPESIIQKDQSNIQVDMKRKLLEDPLLMIRQNEEATKRAITSNPVKMKQLQLLIGSLKDKKKKKKHKNIDSGSKKKKKKKDKKKKKGKSMKKKKKHSRKESSNSDNSSHSSNSGSESETSDEEKAIRREKLKKLIDRETKRATERRQSLSQTKRRSRSRSEEKKESCSRDRSYREHHHHHSSRKDRDRERLNRSRSRSREKRQHRRRSEERSHEEEMRRKREEMMENATRRDAQRKENVERYKEELKKEEEEEEERNAQNFTRKIGTTSVGSSVESRIRSKIGSLQKRNEHMDINFMRK